MVKLYINADPGHPEITAQSVIDSNADGARFVLKVADHDARRAFADGLHRQDKDVIGIIVAGESTGDFPSPEDAARWYHSEYGGTITILQVANEPDLPATWQEPADLLVFTYEVLAGWGVRYGIPVWGPGLASGNPYYLDPIRAEFLRLIDAQPIHPYGQSPDGQLPGPFGNVWDLVQLYRDYMTEAGFPGMPITASEWGISSNDVESDVRLNAIATAMFPTGRPRPDLAKFARRAAPPSGDTARAAYVSAMILEMRELEMDSALFCLGPNMVAEYDILAPDGQPTEMYAAFVNSFV